MKKLKNVSLLLLMIVIGAGCANDSETEKRHGSRDNVVNVKGQIKEIEMEEVLIGNYSTMHLINDYLLIVDINSNEKLVNVFDRKTYRPVKSIINKGEGPGEIISIGNIAVDEANRRFFVTDHGRRKILSYNIDAALADSKYMPEEKMAYEGIILDSYIYISDTLSIGSALKRKTPPVAEGKSRYTTFVARFNMKTGNIVPLEYEHFDNFGLAVSAEKGIYVEAYRFNDLMTVRKLDGELMYNVYGPNYNTDDSNTMSYYGLSVQVCGKRIVSLYSGKENMTETEYGTRKRLYPTKLQIYDLKGNYIKTLETGYSIDMFCYDEDNNRIIMSMDDEIQFGYLDMKGIL